MSERNKKAFKIIYWIYLILIGIILTGFFLLFKMSKADYSFDEKKILEWNTGWILNDNPKGETISVPIDINVKPGDTISLTKRLPSQIKKYNCLMVESKRQDLRVYIKGRIRSTYSDKNTRSVGKSSPDALVLIPLYPEDEDQILTIEFTSDTVYSGKLGEIYVGNEMSLILMLIKENIFGFAMAIIILFIGIGALISGIIYGRTFDSSSGLSSLFWFAILSAVWALSQSKIRQFFFGDIALLEGIGFCCYTFMPLHVVLFSNQITKGRYALVNKILSIFVLLSFVGVAINQIFYHTDIFVLQPYIHVMTFVVLLIEYVICVVEIRKDNLGMALLLIGNIGLLCSVFIALINEINHTGRNLSNVFTFAAIVYLTANFMYSAINIVREQRQKKDAENANIAKSNFLATMSHEIRTPINVVLGMNEMILRDTNDGLVREYASNISNAGKSLLSLVNDILDFSKIEAGKMDILCVEYSTKSLLQDLILMTEGRISEKGLMLKLDIDETIPSKLYGDEVRIKQVITNFMTNAVKYTEKGDIIFGVHKVSEEEGEIVLRFSVKDTGIGIRKEDKKKLLESFVRVDEVRNRNIEGTGLGLTIAGNLLNLMDSHLEIESTYGEGSDFSFNIKQKIIDSSAMGSVLSGKVVEIKQAGMTFSSPEARILAVDDNPMNLAVIKGLLRPTKMLLDVCESGAECLRLCEHNYYDVILMDHMMPEMDGIETLKRLRESYNHVSCGSKVIVLTANAVSGADELYRESGFDAYLTKPIEVTELDAHLRACIPPEIIHPLVENEATNMEQPLTTDIIQGQSAMQYCGDDFSCYLDVLKIYYQHGRKTLLAHKGDNARIYGDVSIEDFTIQIHALKSSSRTIGADNLAGMAERLEAAGKKEDSEYIASNEQECKAEYEKVLNQIEEYLEKKGILPSAATASSAKNSMTGTDSSFGDKAIVGELPEEVRRVLLEAREAIDDFDYDVAMEKLDELLQK